MSTPLTDLDVVLLDCQATGVNPSHGHLIEIAWCFTRGGGMLGHGSVESFLTGLPEDARLPGRVTALTGIRKIDLLSAKEPSVAWKILLEQSRSKVPLPAVAHFSRFEESFLRDLHQRYTPDAEFPFFFVCTHAIARRLFPDLPRRTLRAMAGYFGHDCPRLKRAKDNVKATGVVWRKMLGLLAEEHSVYTAEELGIWLSFPPPPRRRKVYPMPREKRLVLPIEPGVYYLLDSRERVLYVGKASSLKTRVNSHFQKLKGHGERALEMLSRVKNVSYKRCSSALHAALEEADEIKRYRPLYNKSLMPDGRGVWFSTRELDSLHGRPNRRYCVGPLPERRSIIAMGRLAGVMAGDEGLLDDDDVIKILCLPAALSPGPSCFKAGLKLFEKSYAARSVAELTVLGDRLARDSSRQKQVGVDRPKRPGEAWSPERVVETLEGVVVRATRLVRRARWLVWLCEAVLSWQGRSGPNHLAIDRGRVVSNDASRVLSPAGSERCATERRLDFNLATYDRLRILATEIKRLAACGRRIELRLNQRLSLDGRALGRLHEGL